MKVYKAYSIISSSLLEKGGKTKEVRIDWSKQSPDFNDELEIDSYYRDLVENYNGLKESGEDMLWVAERLDYFLSTEEVNGLKDYLYFFYGISLEIEKYTTPVPFEALKLFDEDTRGYLLLNHDLILTDDEKQEWEDVLHLWYRGKISGFKGMDEIQTVEELLRELRK